jgi:hypothetical protein
MFDPYYEQEMRDECQSFYETDEYTMMVMEAQEEARIEDLNARHEAMMEMIKFPACNQYLIEQPIMFTKPDFRLPRAYDNEEIPF